MRKELLVATLGFAVPAGAFADTRFEIPYPSSASAGTLTGRMSAAVARTLTARGGDREPRHGMQDWMRNTQNRHDEGCFLYGATKDRCYDER